MKNTNHRIRKFKTLHTSLAAPTLQPRGRRSALAMAIDSVFACVVLSLPMGSYAQSQPDTTLPAVTVTGVAGPSAQTPYAGGQVTRGGSLGLLGDSNFMDTPFNQTTYTSELIEDVQARSVADVLANDPSVRLGSARTNIQEQFTIRGLSFGSQDTAFNGMYGLTPYWRVPVEMAESIEVLKGPSALLSGIAPSGNVAGAINLIPKRAPDDPLTRVTVGYWSDSQLGTHLDLGRRFGESRQFGVRMNAVYRNGDTVVDDQHETDKLLSLGLDYRGERLRASLDLIHQRQRINNVVRQVAITPTLTSIPAAPDSNLNYPGYGRNIVEDTTVVGRVEYDISSNVTVHAGLGRRTDEMDAIAGNIALLNSNGDFSSSPAWQIFRPETTSFETGATARFATSSIKHKVAVSFSRMKDDADIGFVFPWPIVNVSNLYTPVAASTPSTAGIPNNPGPYSRATLTSYALADTLSFVDDRVLLTVGARRQTVETQSYDFSTHLPSGAHYDESAVTPVAGLVVKPLANLSLYSNYIEGLSKGASALPPAVTAAAALPPMKSKQAEIGAKYDWGTFATTVSLYQIKRPSATVAGGVLSENGMQVNRGLELNAFGQVARDVRILGGVSFMRSELEEMAGGVNEGNDAIGVPHVQASLGVDFDNVMTPGFGLSARAINTGSQYVDQANALKIPSVTTFNVGARYRTKVAGQGLTLRLNIENLFDKSYWATSSSVANTDAGGYLYVGSGRIVMLSGTMDF
jgi:iron complex outermembrane receptor protein